MITEKVALKGRLQISIHRADGSIDDYEMNNLVVNTGLAHMAARLKDNTAAVMSHMALGTGTTATNATQTALVTEVGRVAISGTTLVTTTVANDSVQFQATFPAGTATGALNEAGLFNAPTSGSMLSRTVFPVVNKGTLDAMTVTWIVTAV